MRPKLKDDILKTPREERRVWIVEDVASFLGIGTRKVMDMVRFNEIPTTKIGGARRFDRDEILKWWKFRQTRVS